MLDKHESELRNEAGDGVCTVQRVHCRKFLLKSIEIGSGVLQLPPREASVTDAMRLSGRMEEDSINKTGIHWKRGGPVRGFPRLQETSLTGPLSIYKVVPKVCHHQHPVPSPPHFLLLPSSLPFVYLHPHQFLPLSTVT